jgi:lipopolysaccharide assembly protein A
MRFKTILLILFTVIITIFLMMNTDAVAFNILSVKMEVSKLLVIGIFTVIGFILGYAANGRPKTVISSYDDHIDHNPDLPSDKNSLSDEDREYIS